jgi:hypothetical protein
VREQHERVGHRLHAAGPGPVIAGVLVPDRVEALLDAVGVGEISVVVERGDGGGGDQERQEERGARDGGTARAVHGGKESEAGIG